MDPTAMSPKRHPLLVPAFVSLFLLPAAASRGDDPSSREGPEQREAKIDALFARWDSTHSPGCAVAAIEGDKVVFAKGYGMSNLEYGVPIAPRTVFHVASVSKQFTAFGIVLLARDGKLSLDDDIRKYLPEVPDFGETIRIRHLIHHTSGLRDQWEILQLAGWRMDDVITKRQIFRLVARQRELNFPPGSEHLYCNTGYTLMAEIVERVGGKPFPEWMQERVFGPLGMKQTLFYDDHERIVEGRAYSYYQEAGAGRYKKSVLSYANAGATSLFTTIKDLALWIANYDAPKVGGPEARDMMFARGTLDNGVPLTYASGLSIDEHRGLRRIGHGGADAGYRTFLGYYPDQHFGVIVLSNLASFNPEGKAREVAEIFLGDRMQAPEGSPSEKPGRPDIAKIDPSLLDRYAGTYLLEPRGDLVTFAREGDTLAFAPRRGPRRKLTPLSETVFTDGESMRIRFQRDEQGAATGMTLGSDGASAPNAAGIGLRLAETDGPEAPIVAEIFADGPAARSGKIAAGDRLLGIEGEGGAFIDFRGKALAEARGLIVGPDGSKVRVVVGPKGSEGRAVVELDRALVDGGTTGRRVEPSPPNEEKREAYAGRYESPELQTSYRIVVRNGNLAAEHARHDEIPLDPVYDDHFRGRSGFFNRVQFERDGMGRITGLRVSNGRVRNLLFERKD